MFKIFRAFIPFLIFGMMCIIGNILFLFFLLTQLYRLLFIRNLSRDIVMVSWKLFLYTIRYFNWIHFSSTNIEIKEKGCLVIANHPSLLDIVFLLAHIRHSNCVVKKELNNNIFLYPAIKCSHYITNEFNEDFLNKCINALQNGENLIIFPEGTRTVGKINIHKGASYIAVNGAKKIVLYFIDISPKCLGKHDKWYNLPQNIKYHIQQIKEMDIQTFEKHNVLSLRVRHLHSHIKLIYDRYSNKI